MRCFLFTKPEASHLNQKCYLLYRTPFWGVLIIISELQVGSSVVFGELWFPHWFVFLIDAALMTSCKRDF